MNKHMYPHPRNIGNEQDYEQRSIWDIDEVEGLFHMLDIFNSADE